MDPIEEFVLRICGQDYENMTYGERDAKIIQYAETLGWNVHRQPNGWSMDGKGNRIILCPSIREVCQTLTYQEKQLSGRTPAVRS